MWDSGVGAEKVKRIDSRVIGNGLGVDIALNNGAQVLGVRLMNIAIIHIDKLQCLSEILVYEPRKNTFTR